MRCLIDLGSSRVPGSVAHEIYMSIVDEAVYNAVVNFLTRTGVEIDGPAGYFFWLDRYLGRFGARCSDPGVPKVGKKGVVQPSGYLVVAHVVDTLSSPHRAIADMFRPYDSQDLIAQYKSL